MTFDLHKTNAVKGLALLLLLWHHLFYETSQYGAFIQGSAILAKVCVAIFVFLSGYGIAISYQNKQKSLFGFYRTRLLPIFANYWVIGGLSILVGTLIYGRTLEIAYGSEHTIIKLFVQMSGLYRFIFKDYGFNATWWYMSVIIPLIVIFPFLYAGVKRFPLWILAFFLLLLVPTRSLVPILNVWLLPFALGIYLANKNLISGIVLKAREFGFLRYLIYTLALAFVMLFRNYSPIMKGSEIDWLFAVIIVISFADLIDLNKRVQPIFSYLGGHLFNAFLTHSLIYYYFHSSFIYSFKYPLLIFLVLLILTVILSIIIEFLKKVSGFNWVVGYLSK